MTKESSELDSLLQLSMQVGSDPSLVQGAGGNTSIKMDDTLWIKASGTWLMNALGQNIMVPVALDPLLQALQINDAEAEQTQSFVISEKNPEDLRPSIETTVHAVFPQKIVVHVHCVNTISLALRSDASDVLAPLLSSFNWRFVPYVKPGLSLSRSIASVLYRDDIPADVVVLGNHGLVVAAETVAEANDLLCQVCAALQQPLRETPAAYMHKLQALAAGSDYELPKQIETHAVALDDIALDIAKGGSLYPDHVIFLGEGSVVADPQETPSRVVWRLSNDNQPMPVSIIFPGVGVLMKKGCGDGAQAMARCLADVCTRVPDDASVNYLTNDQNKELLNWDAEQYRQSLNETRLVEEPD